MPELFNRLAVLTVKTKTGRLIDFKDLRISFQIGKDSTSTPNNAKISLYNLSKASRTLFEEEGLTLILKAGYAGLSKDPNQAVTKVIFIGDAASSKTVRKGPDIVTQIEAGDGEKKLVERYINTSFSGASKENPNGTRIKTMLITLIKALGYVPNKDKEKRLLDELSILGNRSTIHGMTMSGPAKHFIDALIEKEGLEWSIQDDEIEISDPKASSQGTAVVLNPQTGLLDVSKEEKNRISFVSLMNPDINPTSFIKITSDFAGLNEAVYKVRKVSYEGDTREGRWHLMGEAESHD